jgi:uncharacterized protein YeaO (DUF488 family)
VIRIKRVYGDPSPDDGLRILVDRVWPRGVSKARARVDQWAKEWAPSTALRKWFAHDPSKWTVFRARYLAELHASGQEPALREIARSAKRRRITLVYSAADDQHNQAVVLKELLETLSRLA